MKKLNMVMVWLVFLVASRSYADGLCVELFDVDESGMVSEVSVPHDEPSATEGKLYSPIYAPSHDVVDGQPHVEGPSYSRAQDVLNAFKFDEGPSPQRNMSIPPEAKDQYVFTSETAEILKQKAAITKRNGSKVIQFLQGHEDDVVIAVREQFERMLAEFGKYYPEIYHVTSNTITNKLTGYKVTRQQVFAKNKGPYELLELVGKLVQEDWLLMKKDLVTGEYILIGGYLAFPTHWSLDRAIGWSLMQIHENLPGTPESRAKFVQMISMVLDRSLAAPERVVVRNNWFVESDPRYALPDYIRSKSKVEKAIMDIMKSQDSIEVKKEKLKKLLCLRIERQTLRGLPKSGVVVFSINPYVYQLATILENPEVAAKIVRGIQLKFPDATVSDLWGMSKVILDSPGSIDSQRSGGPN